MKIIKNCYRQRSDFKGKMRQIRFRLGLRPRPRWGAHSTPPDPLAGFNKDKLKKFLVSICRYWLNCTKFDQLILMKIIKTGTTNC